MTLKEDVYYWYKKTSDKKWRICVVKQGYFYTLDYEPFKVNHINFNYYEFKEIKMVD